MAAKTIDGKQVAADILLGLLLVLNLSCRSAVKYEQSKLNGDYEAIVSTLDNTFPGRGSDHFSSKEKDRPMAYGLILSAEAWRYRHIQSAAAAQTMRQTGQWILDHGDVNDNGVTGFGLADAWDAFGDGTVNPANQEYTITTSMVVQGLMDWLAADPDAPKETIHRMIKACLEPYISAKANSPTGLYAYSLNPNDKEYDVFNPAVHLAGQIQRYSQIVEDVSLKGRLQEDADRIMLIALKHRHKDRLGNWCWRYGLQSRLIRSNDLVHAAFIIDGIRLYCKYGGRYRERLQLPVVMKHLNAFVVNDRWIEHPSTRGGRARLWGLGMALYLLSSEPVDVDGVESLIDQLRDYHTDEFGYAYLPQQQSRVRHNAYLMLGISRYLFQP